MPARPRRLDPQHLPEFADIFASAAEWERSIQASIRRERLARGWSLEEAAKRSGGWLNPNTLSAYERGDRRMTLQMVRLLAHLYDLPIVTLVADNTGSSTHDELLHLSALFQRLSSPERSALRTLIDAIGSADHDE